MAVVAVGVAVAAQDEPLEYALRQDSIVEAVLAHLTVDELLLVARRVARVWRRQAERLLVANPLVFSDVRTVETNSSS